MKTGYSLLIIIFSLLISVNSWSQYQMEKLDRGVLAVRTGTNNFISWRMLGTEDPSITFNLYRGTTKVNASPLTVCNYTDNGAAANSSYTVRAIINGVEQAASSAVTPWAQQYLRVGIQAPPGGTTPAGEAYTYNANDASIADLDGDGQWEIILKWDPTNSKDNSQTGYTGNVYIDAYKLNGTRLWRINLGRNIRAGAHYTQFMVYDFDSDGKAEMMCKTSDGTIDGRGTVIGNASANYVQATTSGSLRQGYIYTGSEFLTVFNGQTGAAMSTVNYVPARGTVSSWGDDYGNRVDRFRAGVAYLDGKKPSAIFCRGYYTRLVVAAYDWNGTTLTNRWTFDSGNSSSNAYYGQGDHSLSIADVDNDGKQEIISGAAIIDDNGTGYYSTKFGHGDALHVSDLDPDLAGLEVFNIQESVSIAGCYMYNTLSKTVLWQKPSASGSTEGPGRAVSADISAAHRGAESWVSGAGISGVFNCKGAITGLANPPSCNFLTWWDGDLLRELLNNTMIDKYGTGRLLTANDFVPVASNNGTKSTPCLSGDFFGDWREEVILRGSANDALYIFTTTIPSNYKFRTFMHDPQYRTAIAWQNGAYNQPPHVSYYLGDGMGVPPKPNITIVGGSVNQAPTGNITSPSNNAIFTAPAAITINANTADADGTVNNVEFFNGGTLLGSDASAPYSFTWANVPAGTYSITVKIKDNVGAVTTSSAVTVVVNNPVNVPPAVNIASPASNAIFTAPALIMIDANATDADGTVSNVEFFNGSTLLGSDASAPYSFAWTNVAAGTYSITARATDNSGAATTSTAVTVVVNPASSGITIQAETACTANGILNETTNAGFRGTGYLNLNNAIGTAATWAVNSSASELVTLSIRYANASINSRNMSVSVNGTVQVATLAFPSTGAWTTWNTATVQINLSAGRNIIQLTSLMSEGAPNIDEFSFASSSVSIASCTVTNQLPGINITWPVNNEVFTAPASIMINASASDSDGTVINVQFFNGTTLLGSDNTAPYSFIWSNVAVGNYTITASATDNSGAVTTSTALNVIVNAPNQVPAVNIVSPANNAIFIAPANITISANANDADGSVSGVEFLVNGSAVAYTTSPFTFVWTNVAAGTYAITARAIDNEGLSSTSAAVMVTVNADNTAPQISITSPASNSIFTAPAGITINANAFDTDGTVSNVQFFNGSTLLGSDASAPYSFAWTNVPAGTYSITATAIDNWGAVTISGSVNVIVNAPPSNVTIQAETACSVNGILSETKNGGYNGTGYVNVDNATGTAVSWVLNSPISQIVTLSIRYASASVNSRNMSASVNGITQVASINFAPTGAWTTWNTISITLNLNSGSNTVRFVSLMSEGGPNIDELVYNPGGVTAGSCAALRTAAIVMEQTSISPNPSAGAFTLTVQESVESFTIMNDLGAVVHSGSSMSEGESLNIGEDLQSGLYIILIQYSSGRTETRKIQKTL